MARRPVSKSPPTATLPLEQQLAAFERGNPKVAEAIRLFGMSLGEYQGAIAAMSGVRITTSTNTSRAPASAQSADSIATRG